jgi:hypothetical protein
MSSKIDFRTWLDGLKGIPRIDKPRWGCLDIIGRWLLGHLYLVKGGTIG